MKRNFYYLFALLYIAVVGCNSNAKEKKVTVDTATTSAAASLVGKPVVPLEKIVKDFNSFWTYFNQGAQLFHDYPTFAVTGEAISKGTFLDSIYVGRYLPLVVYGENNQLHFKLAKLPEGTEKNIGLMLQNYADRELKHYRMEGKPIPTFNFTSITGKQYSSASTKGKIVLFKCWFIGCVQCVAEMPELNELVERYKDRDDVVFISLAIDQEKDLKTFLNKTKFDYETVANQRKYLEKDLNVALYPTHFVINKEGVMVKAVNDVRDLYAFLDKEIAR